MSNNAKVEKKEFGMKKSLLIGLYQYLFAIVAVVISVVYVMAFDKGALPFMDEDYMYLRQEEGAVPDEGEDVDNDSSEEATVITADSFASSLGVTDGGLYKGVYQMGSTFISRFSLKPLGVIGDGGLSLRMGYVLRTDAAGNTLSVHAPCDGLAEIGASLDGAVMQNIRDGEGRVLFYKDGVYYYYENGGLHTTSYDAVNFDKGVGYYPSYASGADSGYRVYGVNGLYGMVGADGGEIVPPIYADVYGVSEDRIVAVDGDGRLFVYNIIGELVTPKDGTPYYAPKGSGTEAEGCFFYKNGLLRVYSSSGESIVIDRNGKAVPLPSGFSVVSYTDGVLLLRQSYADTNGEDSAVYGYMSSGLRWITDPDYVNGRPFYEGLAAVCGADGKWGMIDLDGNTVIPMVYDSLSDCQDGVIIAYEQKYGNYVFGKISS